MKDILYFLSGEVPGGILLLLYILIVVNLVLYYLYKRSKLFSADTYSRKTKRSNIFIIGVYLILWFYLKPAPPPLRVMVLPFQEKNNVNYILCESLQRQVGKNLNNAFLEHRWEWFYETANNDSIQYKDYRLNLAKNIGVDVLISGELEIHGDNLNVRLSVDDTEDIKKYEFTANSYQQATIDLMKYLRASQPIFVKIPNFTEMISDFDLKKLCEAKVALLNKEYAKVLDYYRGDDSSQVELITQVLLRKGIAEIGEGTNSGLQDDRLKPQFRRLLNLIIPFSRDGKDTAGMNLILAQMYLHSKDYEMAEICLEKAISQEKYNSRLYHFLSFLHESRYKERGFTERAAVLRYAVKLDPGYKDAVYELASELYTTGTAASIDPNTEEAIIVLNNFLNLNSNSEEILTLLGRILLQSKYTLEAKEIYSKILDLNPESADNHYNLGICYFHMKKYSEAEERFQQAIKINDYANAYLYIGAMNRLNGNRDKALHYYRERVKRKSGDDDKYAKQAMRGIRVILNEIAEEEEEAKKNETISTTD